MNSGMIVDFGSWKVHIQYDPQIDRLCFHFRRRSGPGFYEYFGYSETDGHVCHRVEEGSLPPSDLGPAMSLDPSAAQALMEALWKHGIRPKDYTDGDKLALVNKHLDDLRTLLFTSDVQRKADEARQV